MTTLPSPKEPTKKTNMIRLIFLLYCMLFASLHPTFGFAWIAGPRNLKVAKQTAPTKPHASLLFLSNGGIDELYKKSTQNPSLDLTVPVLGPIPNQGPLLLGAEIILDPPTPLQWQTVEEAVWQHARLQHGELDDLNQGTIDAAPLVAIMDSTTSTTTPGGRYATLAAIVGMNTASSSIQPQLDMTDSASFMESLQQMSGRGKSFSPDKVRIRLLGVGRVLLRDFFYRLPSVHAQDSLDEQGYVRKMSKSLLVESSTDDDDDEVDEDRMNLVMAHFRILADGCSSQPTSPLNARRNKRTCSPVHALHEMGTWARKMDYLHQDRRRLVAGLQAAKARIALAQVEREHEFDNDYDGLGMLTALRYGAYEEEEEERGASQAAVDDILQIPPAAKQEEDGKSPLHDMENYGMGYSSASFSTLPQVTDAWLDKLEPYYSAEVRATEEYYYEILSFATTLSMDKFLTDSEFAWALTCSNTVERMQKAYEWLFSHVRLLQDEAAQVSAELRECGEECTDLW